MSKVLQSMKKAKLVILDAYLFLPITIDFIIAAIVWYVGKNHPIFSIEIPKQETLGNIMSNLIGIDISLAGFILTALTIIVSLKSNLLSKSEELLSPMESLFSGTHYDEIVSTFKKAIIELSICGGLLYVVWLFDGNDKIDFWFRCVISAIICTSLVVFRSLYVLFEILRGMK